MTGPVSQICCTQVLLMFLLNVLVPNIIFYALLHHNDTERIAHGDNSGAYDKCFSYMRMHA